MEETEITLAAGYGLAAITLQMALLNALAGQGGVPKRQVDLLIEKAAASLSLTAAPGFSQDTIDVARAAINRIAQNWETMQVRH
ncbi:MAG TPA: hypothetical protein VGT78_09385 [Rhizomicrobium sp.]|nr:hypothetical protein [Rhizomicrobium sp.]